ncbi:retrovirus-related pol polyprotein from transposon TNT 1-94 [Tanacetum coccineum]
MGKSKRRTFKTKTILSYKGRLNLLHMNLCGPMRIESINGKKYIPMLVNDYSRFTWTHFLRSKDETPEVLKDFLKMIQRNLQAQTRLQLATDPEMCMFALTVSKSESTNIKEAMDDHAWIKAMQEELHQFDRLNVMEIVYNPFGKTVIDYVVV